MPSSAVCEITGKEFELSDREIEFFAKVGIPLPTLCPEERFRELMATRNERKLYHRKCSATGENIISAYHEEVPFPVYKNAVWWGGKWDAREYGRDFNFSRPFFEQFAKLQKVVPREGTSIFNCENCDYNSHFRNSRNCYMNSLGVGNEDTYYSYWIVNNSDIMDCILTHNSNLCYECSEVDKCYYCVLLQESVNCNNCFFSFQLRGCDHCIFCTNLANKSYHAFNKPCSKEEFSNLQQKVLNGSHTTWKDAEKEFLKMRRETVHRALHNVNCENVLGDHLYNSRNLIDCFDGSGNEDAIHAISLSEAKNIFSSYSAGWPACEMIFRSAVSRGCTDVAFGRYLWFSNAMRYCDSCNASHDCFGCIGLHHREYCILNRQYTKEEYSKLIPKIIGHMQKTGEWGEFFPAHASPFAYNETSAQEYYPLAKEAALQKGYGWRDEDRREYLPSTCIILDNISEVPDGITDELLTCEKTGKNYKVIPQELKFYRKMNLPIPRFHPDTRHEKKIALRNPWKLWRRNCMKCQKEIETTYAPDRTETVYCEECYLETVR